MDRWLPTSKEILLHLLSNTGGAEFPTLFGEDLFSNKRRAQSLDFYIFFWIREVLKKWPKIDGGQSFFPYRVRGK
jgi:hypothetical protein